MMTRAIIFLFAASLLAPRASYAGGIPDDGFYHNFRLDSGESGSAIRRGDTTRFSLSDGTRGEIHDRFNSIVVEKSDGSTVRGSFSRIGGVTCYNFDDGTTGRAYDIGDTTYFSFSNGGEGPIRK